jgi:hypothetical protein
MSASSKQLVCVAVATRTDAPFDGGFDDLTVGFEGAICVAISRYFAA